jgi:hypothetical protein
MPEIAGESALLADPFSELDIANAMTQLCGDEVLRQKLITAGESRAADFSWERSADLLWQSIVKALK